MKPLYLEQEPTQQKGIYEPTATPVSGSRIDSSMATRAKIETTFYPI